MRRFNSIFSLPVSWKLSIFIFIMIFPVSAFSRGDYVFNMQQVEIRAMIATVSEVTGKNFIVDPNVKGKVTIISKNSMSANEVYQTFLSMLDVHGYSVVPTVEVNTFKIIKVITAKSKAVPNDLDNLFQGDQLVTRVIKVQHTQAMQLVQVLRPLVPQHAYLAAYADSNMIVISDAANNISRLVELIQRLDTPGDGNIEMVRLKNASAKDLAQTLSSLNRTKRTLLQVVVADERSNSLLIGGDATTRLNLKALIIKLDSEVNTLRNTNVIYLNYAKAADLAKTLSHIVKRPETKKATNSSEVIISADDNSNALVIKSSYAKFIEIKAVVKKLDIPRAQVHIEAILAEVSYKLEKELGVEWDTRQSDSRTGVFASAKDGLGLKDIFSLSYFHGSDIQAVLKVLQSDTDSNILSTPSLLTLDNQEASIIVGENVPFLTGTQQSQDGLANPFQTIERKDVGLTLKVTPRLNKGSTIIMDIYQEVSTVLPKVQNIAAVDLVTKKRAISTTVMVEDRGMVVLGGLIQDELTNNVNKVPILGDIPIIGEMFKSSKVSTNKANLMVFIRPTILSNPVLANDMAMEKYQFLRSKQQEQQKKGVRLIEAEDIPVLPQYNANQEVSLPNPFETRQ